MNESKNSIDENKNTNELAKALAQAQLEMKAAKKSGFNPHYKSHFPTLLDVQDACLDALNKHGIAVSQTTELLGEHLVVKTMLLHLSGQSICGWYPVHPVQNTPQGLGSALSYARRYALAAIAGVANEDDDGEAASTNSSAGSAPKATVAKAAMAKPQALTMEHRLGPKPTEDELAELFAIAKDCHWSHVDMKTYLSGKLGLESTRDLHISQLDKMIDYMKSFPKEKIG